MSEHGTQQTLILDGPLGTELLNRGVPTPLPGWSAHALESAPETVRDIHGEYAAAGATIHTTNTFRTRPAVLGSRWEKLARKAVELVRDAVPPHHRVAGSIAPLADCYQPAESPAQRDPQFAAAEHRALAEVLADAGCDLLLCETFAHVGESWLAVEAAVRTGLETWVSWTAGPEGHLLHPFIVAEAARGAIERGAKGLLINCVPTSKTLPFVHALVDAARGKEGLRVGAYANVGLAEATNGWEFAPSDPQVYASTADTWIAAGASIVGGCCGTGPQHVAALAARSQSTPSCSAPPGHPRDPTP